MDNEYKKRLEDRVWNTGIRDSEFEGYVQELIDYNRLDNDTVIGIAKQIVSKGVPSLSEFEFKKFINEGLLAENYLEECEIDLWPIEWSDMSYAVERGLCDRCRHMRDKND